MTIFDALAKTAERYPGSPAISYRDLDVTYDQLYNMAFSFACGLSSLGIGHNSTVGILLPNSLPFTVAYFGACRAGAAIVPVNILYKPDETRYLLSHSQADILITAEAFRPLVKTIRAELPHLKHIVMVDGTPQDDEISMSDFCQAQGKPQSAGTDDVAVILYTSGTTGRPKGAMLTHSNLISNCNSLTRVLPVSNSDCFLSALPLFHSFAAMVFLLLPVMVGARIQLMERFMPASTLSLLEQSHVSIFGGVPTMFGLMIQAAGDRHPDLSHLRICISGGAPMPTDIQYQFEDAFNTVVIEGYGLTEASPVVAVNPPFGIRKIGSIGPVIPGVDARIVADDGTDLPVGEIGELVVRGGNVMKGYLNNPVETAVAMRDRWLYTGDLARIDGDDYLYIVGRKKELIIVGGLNVYPGEVERILVDHPAVMEAAAFAVSDQIRGEAVRAAVVFRPNMTATERELQLFCRERLAVYKIPRSIDIRTELPKNSLGKIMRNALKEEAKGLVTC